MDNPPSFLRRVWAWTVALSISLTLVMVGCFVMLAMAKSGALLPVVLASLTAAIGLAANLTFSMARPLLPADAAIPQSLNNLGAMLTSCTLMMLRAAFVSLTAVPFALLWQKNSAVLALFFSPNMSLWDKIQIGVGVCALVYAALQGGSALIGLYMVLPFLINYGVNSADPSKIITPSLQSYLQKGTAFSSFLNVTMYNPRNKVKD